MIDPADLRDVFDRAASLPPQDRAAFLARACGDNAALRQEVERLLAADQRAGSVFDSGSSGSDGHGAPMRDDASALRPGARLGPYVIVGAAGHGGMGEVYRARDTRLDRTVALKVLPSELVRDVTARRRFEREARAAAALSHPHICTLLDIGLQGEIDFLVMEFVDGETLAHRLARETPPLRESLRIGIEIAEALVAAHAAHIVHRDIKPGNVMLRPDGFVKVLDFGLAKLAPIATDGGDTTRALSTRAGLIVGTVAYMSPEQARGQDVDERTDVWSLGCVLYELVARRAPFAGTSTTDVLAAVLQSDPASLVAIDPTTPAELQRIVSKALRKDRHERYQTAKDLLVDLKSLRDTLTWPASHPEHPSTTSPLSSSWRNRTLAAVGVALVIAGGAAWWRVHPTSGPSSTPPPQPVQRSLTRLTFDAGLQTDPTFSPDGRFIAYASDKAGNFDIWVQPVAGGDAVQVTKSPAAETQPSWSPDGSTIAFHSERDGGGLYLVPALGGPERLLVSGGNHPTWSRDGSEIRFLADSVMMHDARMKAIPAGGGAVRTFLPAFTQSPMHWWWIAPHPDGRLSFLGWNARGPMGFYTVDSDEQVTESEVRKNLPPQLKRLLDPLWDLYGRHFFWNAQGTALLLEAKGENGVTNLWRVAVDPKTLEWTSFDQLTTGGGADVNATFSPDGTRIAFSTLTTSTRIWRFGLDQPRKGELSGQPVTEDLANASPASVSADGEMMIFNFARPGSLDRSSLWMKRFDTGASGPVDVDDPGSAKLSPDKHVIAFTRFADPGWMIFAQPFGGAARQITPRRPVWEEACDWLPDGRLLVSYQNSLEAWPMNLPGPASAPDTVFRIGGGIHSFAGLAEARFSPDHRWLAFVVVRDVTVGAQVGITSATGPPDRAWTPIPTTFSWTDKPRWSRDGKRLYFYAVEGSFLNLWAIGFDSSRGVTVGEPVRVARYDSPAFRIDPEMVGTGLGISDKFAFVPMRAATGNIWMLDSVDR
jgi:eukaryotic-like serine/threonine-protein kinase